MSTDREQQFKEWLDGMEVALDEFMADLPDTVESKLDGSIESLDVLQSWLLEEYPSHAALKDDPDVSNWDGAARYLGQILARELGGEWQQSDNGPPEILNPNGPWPTPMLFIGQTVSKREDGYLRKLVEKNVAFAKGS